MFFKPASHWPASRALIGRYGRVARSLQAFTAGFTSGAALCRLHMGINFNKGLILMILCVHFLLFLSLYVSHAVCYPVLIYGSQTMWNWFEVCCFILSVYFYHKLCHVRKRNWQIEYYPAYLTFIVTVFLTTGNPKFYSGNTVRQQ
jgi:hypothetical protein